MSQYIDPKISRVEVVDSSIVPLPTGAATAANQVTTNSKLDTTNSELSDINDKLVDLNDYTDNIEALILVTNNAIAQLEGFVDELEAVTTEIEGHVDGVEAGLTTINNSVKPGTAAAFVRVTITNSATEIASSPQAGRKHFHIKNLSEEEPIWIYHSNSVSTANGYPLAPANADKYDGGSITLPLNDGGEIWGITATGSHDVSVVQVD